MSVCNTNENLTPLARNSQGGKKNTIRVIKKIGKINLETTVRDKLPVKRKRYSLKK
jgi:hypothetical protein